MFRHRENEVIQKDPVRTLGECNGYNGDADIASALHVVNKIVAGLVTEKWMEAVGYWSRSAERFVPRSWDIYEVDVARPACGWPGLDCD